MSLSGNYPPMAVPLKIDITTGDKITPREMVYSFNLMFEERSINVLAYTVETILAENLKQSFQEVIKIQDRETFMMFIF